MSKHWGDITKWLAGQLLFVQVNLKIHFGDQSFKYIQDRFNPCILTLFSIFEICTF